MPSDTTTVPPAEGDTNLPAKRAVRAGAPVKAGAPVAALVPRTIDEAWRLAMAMARSGLSPKDMKRPEQVMVAIMAGAEVGLPPMQAVMSIAVINGRPTMWGDGLLGVVQANGVRLKEWIEGEGDARTAHCIVTRPGEDPVERTFSVAMAKTAKLWNKKGRSGEDTPWVTYPERMLQMRARSWGIRDACSDITRGIVVREEAMDMDYEVLADEEPPTVSAFLDADLAAEDGSAIEITDAPPPEEVTAETAPSTTEPAHDEDEGAYERATDAELAEADRQEAAGVPPEEVTLKSQASAFEPTLKWVAQVRAAFETTKTRVDLESLTARWNNDASLETRAKLAKADPKMAMMLEGEFNALTARINPEEKK